MGYQLPVVFEKILSLTAALKVEGISALPGAWIHQVDEVWGIAINPHDGPVSIPADGHKFGATVPPFSVFVWFNGWPAGIVDASGGVIAAGVSANEDTFCTALDNAIQKARGESCTLMESSQVIGE